MWWYRWYRVDIYEEHVSHREEICIYIYSEVIEPECVFKNQSHLVDLGISFSKGRRIWAGWPLVISTSYMSVTFPLAF